MHCELTAVYEPLEDGSIRAYVLEVPGSRAYGKTIAEARSNLAELIQLTLNSFRVNLLKKAHPLATLEPLSAELPELPAKAKDALMAATRAKTRSFTRDDVNQALLDKGIISEIRPPLPRSAWREEHEPVQVEGKPISEEIIEGRR
jgi:predicted RNase H-like HicB family nuclease